MVKISGKIIAEWQTMWQGTTGHSQGIVSSVVIASAKTEQELIELSQKALGFLFWVGLRSQKAFPTSSISSRILQDSFDNQEGVPTPMLIISGKYN